jgi:hypothetical protein
MKSAIAIAVLAVTAATVVLAQDNPSVGEPTNPTIPKEEQIRLGKVERLRSEQEWFRLEQMWVSMREQMRQQILQEIQAGVPPEQIQTEIQGQQQILQEPAPEYSYVPVAEGPIQTVFITPMDQERYGRQHHERESWEKEHLEHERIERERIERHQALWEKNRTQTMQRLRATHPEIATRVAAGIAKVQSPTAQRSSPSITAPRGASPAPGVSKSVAQTAKSPPPSAPAPRSPPPTPAPRSPAPAPAPKSPPPPPPQLQNKGTKS